jgi:proline racemase
VHGTEVVTVDYHTAGEPFRIVTAGGPPLPGESVADRRARALEDPTAGHIRRLLCHEPRGHADMYGGFLCDPDDDGGDVGVLFWHKDGFSTACGHGTIALGTWAVESGRVAGEHDGLIDVVIDVPSGRVLARVRCTAGAVQDVTFRNVPSFVIARDVPLATHLGTVAVDISFGGAIYASVPAAELELSVEPKHVDALIAAGRAVKAALAGSPLAEHPTDPRLSGIYGTILWEDLGDGTDGPRQRNVTVFADGEADRSPCGSGSSARAVLLAADGRLAPGQTLHHESIVGSVFTVRAAPPETLDGRPTWITEVTGSAYRTGEHRFVLDPRDPLGTGFTLR